MAMNGTIEAITGATFPLVEQGIKEQQARGIVSDSLAETAIATAANLAALRAERAQREERFARSQDALDAAYQERVSSTATIKMPARRDVK